MQPAHKLAIWSDGGSDLRSKTAILKRCDGFDLLPVSLNSQSLMTLITDHNRLTVFESHPNTIDAVYIVVIFDDDCSDSIDGFVGVFERAVCAGSDPGRCAPGTCP